jgi:hypothetical protein
LSITHPCILASARRCGSSCIHGSKVLGHTLHFRPSRASGFTLIGIYTLPPRTIPFLQSRGCGYTLIGSHLLLLLLHSGMAFRDLGTPRCSH